MASGDAPLDAEAESRLLRLLGLGVRSRGVIVGVEMVRQAAKKGTLVLAIVAPDASHHSREKVLPLLHARRVPVIEGPTSAALGAAVGRETAAAVGVVDRELANGIAGSAK
ncbi:MAG TPA: ribosomal L7Ae/L30e/S12e/Gadd45 family protein [Gemmatimonadaceae bacterium]|nr:ribosomal L7Ae/L30e/S12e/Gadd45 family protein [Gemmatimonadaceae bacterium]